MTSPEVQAELGKMREAFYADDATEEQQVKIAERMRELANEEMPESKCLFCKQTGFFIPHTHALIEGHCYSEDGLRDYTRITMVCEFCFDKVHVNDEGEEGGEDNGDVHVLHEDRRPDSDQH